LVRRFATETKRSPDTEELIGFLSEIGVPQAVRVQ